VPGYALARVPARWMIVPAFLVAVAAGETIHALRSGGRRIHSARIVALVIGAVLVASAVGARQAPGRIVVLLWVVLAVAVTAGCWLRPRWVGATILCVLLAGELGRLNTQSFGRKLLLRESVVDLAEGVPHFLASHPGRSLAVTNDAAPTAYLVNGLRPNANDLVGVRSVDGYDGGVQVTSRWIEAMGGLAGGPLDSEVTLRGQIGGPLDVKAWARFGLHYLVIDHDRTDAATLTSGWRGPVFSEKTLEIWENPSWVGEATLTDPTGVVSAAVVTQRRDGAATITTNGAGVLRLDEQYTPEWTATIDGKKASVLHVEGFSVGVTVPAGAHIVQFRYDPPLFRLGLVLSALALVALLGLVFFSRLPRGRRTGVTTRSE
jgi:Bacterial membrane protein YfhO